MTFDLIKKRLVFALPATVFLTDLEDVRINTCWVMGGIIQWVCVWLCCLVWEVLVRGVDEKRAIRWKWKTMKELWLWESVGVSRQSCKELVWWWEKEVKRDFGDGWVSYARTSLVGIVVYCEFGFGNYYPVCYVTVKWLSRVTFNLTVRRFCVWGVCLCVDCSCYSAWSLPVDTDHIGGN